VTGLLVGMDVGGTKAAVRAVSADGDLVVDSVFSSTEWSASPPPAAAAWLTDILARALPAGAEVEAMGVGAQGCDTQQHCDELSTALGDLGFRAVVVNDAALLAPASGLDVAIGIIAGTGAIGVGSTADGDTLIAGGWGWVISDDAGAAGLVRTAVVAALTAHEEQRPDDGLLSALQSAFGVDGPESLARAVNDEPTPENWGPRAPTVFAAADSGSALAERVIDDAAAYLVRVTGWLVARGAQGSDVVLAGSVVAGQPRLELSYRRQLAIAHPQLAVRLLDVPPVVGGVALARVLAAGDPPA
jgi:N-acetylglucosamine kinase-like BadF-type ATPase